MEFCELLAIARKTKNMTQAKLAEEIYVSPETVAKWERGDCIPDRENLAALEDLLHLSWFDEDFANLDERIFSEKGMFSYLKERLSDGEHPEALRALPYAREKHEGMTRKGPGCVPYIIHPLTMTCHALAMGLEDDALLAALLLHDVAEDCGISSGELPFCEEVRQIVALVTKPGGHGLYKPEQYFGAIRENPKACLVKLIDRCNNLSGMASGLGHERMREYISETKRWYPRLLREIKQTPEYAGPAWLLEYMMKSLLEATEKL